MEKISVPHDEIVPLDHISDDVSGFRTFIVNLFAIGNGRDWVLVDAGLRGQHESILRWAREHVSTTAPRAILLTHAHFDHVGSLEALLEEWNVPVFVHPDELPFVTGAACYPPPDPTVGGGLMSRLSSLYPREPIDIGARAQPLPGDYSIPVLPTWRWIPTPGHSAGHVSFFEDRRRTLIVGDAFCTTKQESLLAVATQRPELHGPPAYFTVDWNLACDSVQRLAALEPRTIAPGHGRPMTGPAMAEALHQLADRFDDVARPEHGRYIAEESARVERRAR